MHLGDEDMCGEPVALVDDDITKHGRHVHGVKVYGACDDIPRIAQECRAEQIVLACPSALASERQRILSICLTTGLRILTLPNVRDLAQQDDGRIALREVEISELLSRDEVAFDSTGMGYVRDQVVLVTGGGGSIGSELVRQLIEARPSQIIIFDVYENTAYELLHEMQPKATELGVTLSVVIGSVTNERIVRDCFQRYRPKVVFHAAAHKHVPLMEDNAREAVENNVLGTWVVCRLAEELGCSHCILVSTDKAVNPTNVMGATKRLAEMILQYQHSMATLPMVLVRFGNVLGSSGSVIPKFREQIANGGPITVTHPDITRYFMSIPEATQLVLQAGLMGRGGETFVLDMGQPIRIVDLARTMVRLSGYTEADIPIAFTGLRPGEKLFEELLADNEKTLPTPHAKLRVSRPIDPPGTSWDISVKRWLESPGPVGDAEVRQMLTLWVPEYKPAPLYPPVATPGASPASSWAEPQVLHNPAYAVLFDRDLHRHGPRSSPDLAQKRAHTSTPYGLLVPHHQATQRRNTNENSRWPPITCQDVMNQVCRPNTGAMRRIVALSACTPPDMSNVSPPARDSFHRLTQNPQNTATIAPSEHHRHFEVPHIKSHISPKKESNINQHK